MILPTGAHPFDHPMAVNIHWRWNSLTECPIDGVPYWRCVRLALCPINTPTDMPRVQSNMIFIARFWTASILTYYVFSKQIQLTDLEHTHRVKLDARLSMFPKVDSNSKNSWRKVPLSPSTPITSGWQRVCKTSTFTNYIGEGNVAEMNKAINTINNTALDFKTPNLHSSR